MVITIDLVVWASLSLCPGFLIIGLALGAILMHQFQTERAKKMVRVDVTVRAGEWYTKVVPMLDAGWTRDGVTPSEINGFFDVHLSRRM